jgi:hypothetical protein
MMENGVESRYGKGYSVVRVSPNFIMIRQLLSITKQVCLQLQSLLIRLSNRRGNTTLGGLFYAMKYGYICKTPLV